MCTCLSRALNFKSLTITNTISITLAHLAWFVSNFLTFSRSRSFSLPFLSFSFYLWFVLFFSFFFSIFTLSLPILFWTFTLPLRSYPYSLLFVVKMHCKNPNWIASWRQYKNRIQRTKKHLTSLALFFFYFAIIVVDSFFLFARECVFGALVVSHAQADHNQLLYVLCVCVMNMRDRSTHKRPTNTSITHKQKLQALILVYVTVLRN